MLPRPRTRDLLIVLGRVAIVLVALELLYLVVGNLVVRSQLIKHGVASADGFHLDYGRAYTIWPGRVHIDDFSLRVDDYNVQFEIAFDQAQVDISLSDLLFKTCRVTRLEAEGTRFRMRHKLIAVGDDAERIAAYPPIRGFADPPYYVGIRPPSISDEEANDLWEVRVENVHARVSELWMMEHRFRGVAVATGAFVVKPTRWVQVLPAALSLERGGITLGNHVVADQVQGSISFEIPDYYVQAREGLQVFKEISTRMDLQLSRGKLDFLQAYLARLGPARYSGDASWQIAVVVQRGQIAQGSRVSLLATPLTLHHPYADVSGEVMLSLGRLEPATPGRLTLALSAPRLVTLNRRNGAAGPTFEGLEAGLLLDGIDLTGNISLGPGQVALSKARAPSLSWFETRGTQLSGEAQLELMLARDAAGGVSGRAKFFSPGASLQKGTFAAQTALRGSMTMTRGKSEQEIDVTQLELRLSDTTLRTGKKRSKPFGLSLDASGLRIAPGSSPRASGTLHARVSSAEALLPLFVGDVLRDLGSSALDLRGLEARAYLELQREGLALTRIDAQSGKLRMRGHVEKRDRAPTGALLLSSGMLNVGVTLKGGDAELSPFVADDWLTVSRAPAGS